MERFIKKGVLLSLIFFIFSFIFLKVVDFGLKKERLGWIKEGNVNAEVLILGSSRAYRHFNSDFLSKTLGMKFFNLGYDASGLETQLVLLEYYLKNNATPKIIVWEYNYGFLNFDPNVYEYIDLIPLVDDPLVSDYLIDHEIISERILYFPLSRYLVYKELIKKGLNNLSKDEPFKDYKIQDLNWDKHNLEKLYLNSDYKIEKEISNQYLNQYRNTIDKLKNIGVKVVMVFTPIYSGIYQKEDDKVLLLDFYDSLFFSVKVLNINYNDSDLSRDTLNFYNVLHMNKKGVDSFMVDFERDIKRSLDE
ncbi:hypothetical protein [Rhodonellum sp.]|uniref:hypothetical protein n=1 Tax=Rhodonellum sp. TaxID=2231180 RepID=UPI002723C737|nr:hypothetical protein [Rhodonellum sp.]MDO9553102.1 hypothetical protein [Rhodonellum sp.]